MKPSYFKDYKENHRACLTVTAGFVFIFVLNWADEILDFPHVLFHVAATPINWTESIMESIVLVVVGAFTIYRLMVGMNRRNEVERKLVRLQNDLTLEKYKLEKVLDIDNEISSILRLNHLVDFVVEQTTKILEADRCSLMLLDEKNKELIIKGAKGIAPDVIKETRIPIGEGIAGMVARDSKPLLVRNTDYSHYVTKEAGRYVKKSFIVAPIKLHKKVAGVVNVTNKRSDKGKESFFNDIDLKILRSIIHQAAISIENANYYQELEFLTRTDFLTGLFNHRHFVVSLDNETERSRRYGSPLSLLMIDVDDFKDYNDDYGQVEGDNLLKNVAKVLREETRAVDIPCSYAGDEFAVILPETEIENAKGLAQKIIKKFSSLPLKRKITVSIGISQFGHNVSDRLNLILKADQALYQAKKKGKNTIALV